MGKKLTTIVMVLLIGTALAFAERVEVGNPEQDVSVTVLESNQYKTVVRFEVGAFNKDPIDINGDSYFKITADGENNLIIKGDPSLPRICRSIIIPDDAAMQINVIAAEYTDIPETPVAPSKGSIPRTILPDEVPYTFGKVYEGDEWAPGELAAIREPFIMRDFRGTVIELNAFQYNPARRTLRVYTSVTVEVVDVGPGEVNILDRDKSEIRIVPEFDFIYSQRFINYEHQKSRYPMVGEVGDILIITYDGFHDAVVPLAEWKLQKGIPTTLVDVSTIGNNDVLIKNFIDSVYDNSNLCFVLLVGDAAQIDVPYSGGDSDPTYSKLEGSDNWPDILVGRFSAETVAQAETQVLRTINYEKTPYGTDWYQKAMGVASNQGVGDDGEYDDEHMDNIRLLLLAYGFTHVDQIYDPTANATMVANAVNDGRSFANYCGHGSTTSWSSSGFSSSHVNNLVNDWMLPLVFSVACVNGNFVGTTCFAEAWLRATNGDAPTGAIATYMSTINQYWDEPMEAQDECTNLLVAETMTTVGGLCYNGSCSMMEDYGSSGVTMFNTWHIFGDPSVQMRVKNPQTLTVNHTAAHIFTLAEYDVNVPGVEGALCALYHGGTLYGSAYTDATGNATITITGDLPIGEAVTLTVTGYHRTPYFGEVQIIAPEGPFVIYDYHNIDDAAGNNDGVVNCGEAINMTLGLQNVGPDTAFNVSVALTTADEYITLTDDNEIFGMIPGDFGLREITGAFAFEVSENMPNDHIIEFNLAITGSDTRDTTWNSTFTVEGHCYPAATASPTDFVDSLFLDDYVLDSVFIYNDGHAPLYIEFTCLDNWLDFASGQQTVPAHDSMIFEVVVSSATLTYGDHYCTLDYTCNDPLNAGGSIGFSVHIYSPDIHMPETAIEQMVPADGQATCPFIINNNGPGQLEYGITRLMFNGKRDIVVKTSSSPLGYRPVDDSKTNETQEEPYYAPVTRGSGGPDLWGYNWVDSDEPGGPAFEWVDISAVGTAVTLGDDDTTTAITIGFSFPFYENYYSELYIGSNGIITFGGPSKARTNQPMPVAQIPNNMIAMWWDDLDPSDGGNVYYYHDAANERFIISFDGVPNYKSPDGTGSLTLQAILHTNGQIKLQYGVMEPGEDYNGLAGATIGIEDAAGTDGLEVVYNAEYMHDNLAILFTAAQWLSVDPGSGIIAPFSADTINVGFDASDMSEGTYTGQLQINSNDPDTPYQEVPVTMNVSIGGICGDVNGDQNVNIIDINYLVAYLYNDGPPPFDLDAADVNNDDQINITDISALINYLYGEGSIDCGY